MQMPELRRLSDEYAQKAHEIATQCFSLPWSVSSFIDGMNTPTQCFFGAFIGGILVGYISVMTAAGEGEILSIAVLPEYRKCGIASMLLEKSFKLFENNNCEKVFLEVRQSNIPAQKLYEKYGFAKVGVRKKYYSSPIEDAILYEKSLT